jgi:phage-related protein
MASKEEIQKKNIDEANDALGAQLNLVSNLQDQMSQLLKVYREKGTLDKLSLDNVKAVLATTKSLKSEYDSVKDVQKDLVKNVKLQQDIERQNKALFERGGNALREEIKSLKIKEESLSKAQNKLAQMESDKKLGRKVDEALYKQAQATVSKKQEQLNLANEILTPEAQQVVMLEEAEKINQKNNEYLSEQLTQQNNLVKSQGLITASLTGANNLMKKFGLGALAGKLGLEAAAQKAKDMTYELTEGGKKSLGAFGKLRVGIASIGAAFKSALGPIALITAAISAIKSAYEKGEEAAKRLSDENVGLARTMGVAQSTANKIAGEVRGIGAAMGITGGQATAAAGAIYSSLDGAEKLSRKTLDTFVRLNVFAGMSADSIADIQKLSKLTGKDAGVVADEMARTAQESIKSNKVNVSMRTVMMEVGKTSAIVKLNMGGSATAITSAVVQSKKLGLELKQVEDIANGLLNIEDSIAAEMEAELLTGKELNLEKAREAALNNDNVTLMNEIAEQFGSIEDFQKMNRVQQEAFAKSIGMSRDGLAEMLVNSKENAAANTDLVSEQDKGLAAMQSMASVSEQLAAREEARANQFAKIFELLHPIVEAFKSLGPLVLELITPIVEALVPHLQEMVKTLLPVIKDIFKSLRPVIESLLKALDPILGIIVDMAKNFLPLIGDLFRQFGPIVVDLLKAISPLFTLIGDMSKKFLPLIAGLFKQMIPIVADLVKQLVPIVTEVLNLILPILKPILDIFIELTKMVIPVLVDLLKGIVPIIKPILTIFTDIFKVVSGILKGDWSAVADGLKKIGAGILNLTIGLFESLLNLPIKAINAMIDFVPGFGANTIPKVKLPRVALAEGGVVTKPTNALIGEAGPEAVVPLNSDKSMNINTKALEAKIDRLISVIERGGVVTLDGQKVGQALVLGSYRTQ